jgi:hypothetical protein
MVEADIIEGSFLSTWKLDFHLDRVDSSFKCNLLISIRPARLPRRGYVSKPKVASTLG